MQVHAIAIKRAIELYGEQALAIRLGTTPAQLAQWATGAEPLPESTFLQLADLLWQHALASMRHRPQDASGEEDRA